MNTDLFLTKLRELVELQRQVQGALDATQLETDSAGDYPDFGHELSEWMDTLDAQVKAESALELAKTALTRWMWEEDHFELGIKMVWDIIYSEEFKHLLRHPHHLDELAVMYKDAGLS